ncbi:MAG: hypothetical protein ACR2MG_10740 [Pyrinomonadaceae bacterium]
MSPRSDDKSIADEELLWRRICDVPQWIKKLEDGEIKPSSAAFLDNFTNEVSVNVASLTTQEKVMEKYPDMGLVSIKAGMPRSIGHIIAATPEIEDTSHRVICPPPDIKGSKRKSLARRMAEESKWILYPKTHRN